MTGAPVNVYLDVDGVLLAFDRILAMTRVHQDWVTYQAGQAYRPAVVDALNDLAARPNVRMHWLTVWEDRAATVLAPAIGLNGADWPVVGHWHHRHEHDLWWKVAAIHDHLANGLVERAVWVDDDITTDIDAMVWLQSHPRVWPVSPDPLTGLQESHLRMLREWTA